MRTKGGVYERGTVKPRPEAHMDMILFEVFLLFEEYPLDSTRSDSTMTLSII